MLKELLDKLKVREANLPWVHPLLSTLLRGTRTLAVTIMAIGALLEFVQLMNQSMSILSFYLLIIVFGLLLFAAVSVLQRQNQQEPSVDLTSKTVNLLLATITVYVTLAVAPGALLIGPAFILYALPIMAAVLLLAPEAGLIWATIVTLVILVRALVLAIFFAVDVEPIALAGGIIALYLLAMLGRVLGHSLRQARQSLRQQVRQGQAGIEIGRTISASLDPTSIVQQVVQLIGEAFDYYHVGLFTLDSENGTAVLMDAAGDAADDVKERSIPVSLSGATVVAAAIRQKYRQEMVTWKECIDLAGSPIEFTYEWFPSRVEFVIPLQVGERVLGALDIHSIEMTPFSKEDIHTLEGLAGLVANALESARLLDDVQQRHQELESAHVQTERRSRYLEATAELARAISSLLDPQKLLDRAVHLVSESLGLYHAGIFLIDEKGEWAVLAAANSKGGQQMLARGHKLRVGEQGFVGMATHTGQSYIGLDVGDDAVHFVNPDLPDTRSEIALPLKVSDRVIGALDVQSVHEAAFGEEDIAVLQTLADQITIAIENARLFQGTQRALEEMQDVQRTYVAQEWEQISRRRTDLGAEYLNRGVPSLEMAWTPEMKMAMEKEAPVILSDLSSVDWGEDGNGQGNGDGDHSAPSMDARSALVVPIKWRDEVIGVLDVQELNQERHWTQEDVEIATAVADQLALALENARLFEEAERRASQLSAASEVARESTSILENVGQLLSETVHLISEQFKFYHAAVFLVDEKDEYAVLRAASSEGGKRMLARHHKTPVAKSGIVGYVAATGEPRVALDVGKDAIYFAHSDLPNTRSEMGLPLKVRERVIGVLNVQSTDAGAFSDDDMGVLQTLADQLAGAIANARLFQEVRADATRRALINEVQQAVTASLDPDELLRRAGKVISRRLERHSAVFIWEAQQGNLRPVAVHDRQGQDVLLSDDVRLTREMNPALFSDVIDRHITATLDSLAQRLDPDAIALAERMGIQTGMYVPLVARDQVLGVLAISQPEGDSLERDLIDTVGANVSVALESARLYQEAVDTAEQLQEMDRLKNQFLANMSHELRTPLNSIIGFSRVILKGIDGPLTDMQRTDLEAVYNSGQHLLELINGILDIAKIQAGKMELSFEETRMRDVIKIVMSTAIALVKDKPIELQQHVPDDLPTIRADPRRVRQILLNLVGNASKFTEEGFIRVGVTAAPTEVIIAVKDSGIGIPADRIDTIFEEFTQVDGSSTRAIGGTGLGLSISQHFVEMHAGRIWIESTPGVGSTFFVALPIKGPPEEMEEDEDEKKEDKKAKVETTRKVKRVKLKKVELPKVETQKIKFKKIELKKVEPPRVEPPQAEPPKVEPPQVETQKIKFKKIELKKVEPPQAEPPQVEPPQVETQKIKFKKIELKKVEPPQVETQKIKLKKIELKKVEPPKVEPQRIKLKKIELKKVEPPQAEPPKVEPPKAEPPKIKLKKIELKKAEPKKQEPKKQGPKTVLCVDDDEGVIMLFRRYLSKQGYRVLGITESLAVVEIARRIQPFAITLDVMMPAKDGWQVIQELKSHPETRDIPVIMCSIIADQDHGVSLGASGYLIKPIMERELLSALERLDRSKDCHRVLVVDDHVGDRNLLRRMIETQDGYEVIDAAGGKEAIALVQQVQPDIIILDLMMPDVDGFAVLEAVKANEATRSIPIIVVTAKSLTWEERNTLNQGVESLLQKGGFERQSLLADVSAALERLKVTSEE